MLLPINSSDAKNRKGANAISGVLVSLICFTVDGCAQALIMIRQIMRVQLSFFIWVNCMVNADDNITKFSAFSAIVGRLTNNSERGVPIAFDFHFALGAKAPRSEFLFFDSWL